MKQEQSSIQCSLLGVLDKDSSAGPSSISQQKTFFTPLLEGAVLFVQLDTCTNEQFVQYEYLYFKDFEMGCGIFVA